MKKVANLSKIFILAVMATGCTNNDNKAAPVNAERYESRACWIDRRGDFEAFLVLAQAGRMAVPYLISARCLGTEGNRSYGESTVLRLDTVKIIDRFGSLQRVLSDVVISDSIQTDQPTPSPNSKVYYFRARLTRLPSQYRPVYAPQEVLQLTDMNVSFVQFLDMPTEQRDRLSASLRH